VIAKRVCLDIHRQRARSQPAESIDPGATADGEQAVLTSMDAAAVQDALGRLTSRHRDVLHLREYEGWSYRRIATHYGVRLAAVETLLWRARRALHRQLTMAGYERRALVSLPVAGWAYRRLGSMRARIEEWGGQRLAPVVGSVASVVTIGALVIGATGSGAHAHRPQPLIASHAPSADPTPQPPVAPSIPGITPPSVPAVSASLPAAPPLPSAAGQVAAAGGAAVLGATFTNAAAASQQAHQEPVHASVAGVTAGINPKATASGLVSTADTSVNQLRRSIP
jgi:hypothetical protein